MMNLSEIKQETYKLLVSDRLALIEAIIRSLSNELRPRPPVPEDIVQRMTGLASTDIPPPNDAQVAAMLEERLVEKYQK